MLCWNSANLDWNVPMISWVFCAHELCIKREQPAALERLAAQCTPNYDVGDVNARLVNQKNPTVYEKTNS